MRIFRVEDATGRGPHGFGGGKCQWGPDGTNRPSPCWDGIKAAEISPDHYFGFTSIEQILRWNASDEIEPLDLAFIAEFQCHPRDVLIGYNQVAFVRHRAIPLKKYPFIRILEVPNDKAMPTARIDAPTGLGGLQRLPDLLSYEGRASFSAFSAPCDASLNTMLRPLGDDAS